MTNRGLNLPALTTDQMVEVDRLMVEEWGISLLQMMENAGRNFAELARTQLGGTVKGSNVVVPMEEVARRMNTNRNALYKLLHDARLRLKHRLEREGISVKELIEMFGR